jgi:hypothetical protein
VIALQEIVEVGRREDEFAIELLHVVPTLARTRAIRLALQNSLHKNFPCHPPGTPVG